MAALLVEQDEAVEENIDLWASFELWADDELKVLVLIARRGKRARVASMGVPAGARRQGWGRRGLEVALDEAQSRGDSLQLEVISSNLPAVRLYESMGFVRRRTLVGFEAPLAPLRGSAGPDDLAEMPLADAARVVATHASDLSWQLDSPTLYAGRQVAGLAQPWGRRHRQGVGRLIDADDVDHRARASASGTRPAPARSACWRHAGGGGHGAHGLDHPGRHRERGDRGRGCSAF